MTTNKKRLSIKFIDKSMHIEPINMKNIIGGDKSATEIRTYKTAGCPNGDTISETYVDNQRMYVVVNYPCMGVSDTIR